MLYIPVHELSFKNHFASVNPMVLVLKLLLDYSGPESFTPQKFVWSHFEIVSRIVCHPSLILASLSPILRFGFSCAAP